MKKTIKVLGKRLAWVAVVFSGISGYVRFDEDYKWIAAGILGGSLGILAEKMWPFEEEK